MSHRLFVAHRPPRAVREALLATMHSLPGARWQDDAQLHLTLRFIGNIETPQAEDLATELERVRAAPFPLAIESVGHFEKKGRPHTLWAGVTASQPLAVLQGRIERACRKAGLEPETRHFTPHITLARLNSASASPGRFIAEHGALTSEPWTLDAFDLVESHLGNEGSRYETIYRYSLSRA